MVLCFHPTPTIYVTQCPLLTPNFNSHRTKLRKKHFTRKVETEFRPVFYFNTRSVLSSQLSYRNATPLLIMPQLLLAQNKFEEENLYYMQSRNRKGIQACLLSQEILKQAYMGNSLKLYDQESILNVGQTCQCPHNSARCQIEKEDDTSAVALKINSHKFHYFIQSQCFLLSCAHTFAKWGLLTLFFYLQASLWVRLWYQISVVSDGTQTAL